MDFIRKFLFYLFCMMFSCSYKESPHIIAAYSVMGKFEKSLAKNHLDIFGKGGSMMKNIEEFSYDLISDTDSNIDESRKVIVETVENFIQIINNDKIIRQYLRDFPFYEKSIYISIKFLKNEVKCESFISDKVYIVQSDNDKNLINYFKNTKNLELFYSEHYAEAYEKVYGVPLPDRLSQIKDLDQEYK